MPQFSYIAKEGPQKIVEGTVEAETLDNAVAKVLNLGYAPIEVKGLEERSRPTLAALKSQFHFLKKISESDVTLFTRQIYDLADAEVPIKTDYQTNPASRLQRSHLPDPFFC